MLRLLLLRHAKAEQDSGEGDFARALTERGRADAAHIGHALQSKDYVPDLVLCSTAKRTTETFEMLVPEFAKPPRVEFLKVLYLASTRQISDVLRTTPDGMRTVMTIGHNPGTEDLAARLARKPQSRKEAQLMEKLRDKYPTCGLAVLDFELEVWTQIAPATGTLTDFLRPKDVRD